MQIYNQPIPAPFHHGIIGQTAITQQEKPLDLSIRSNEESFPAQSHLPSLLLCLLALDVMS